MVLMQSIFKSTLYILCFIFLSTSLVFSQETVWPGLQPQPAMDNAGNIRIVYGTGDSILCATAKANGQLVGSPALVGQIKGMHLGMSRGPQIASSKHYSIIIAIDKAGNIHCYRLTHGSNKWIYQGVVNDISNSAPEGLMSIAADNNDHFYAAWLDIRHDKTNNICFASCAAGATSKWTRNKLVYISPDGHVCECCKPSIVVKGTRLCIMYRNWMQGSRDLYILSSADKGSSFNSAQKLGSGTWKLDGCPMDGGSIQINSAGNIETVWQREGSTYYCQAGAKEIKIANGRNCSLVIGNGNNKHALVALQNKQDLTLVSIGTPTEVSVGKGSFLKAVMLHNKQVLCFWEQDNTVHCKKINLPLIDLNKNNKSVGGR